MKIWDKFIEFYNCSLHQDFRDLNNAAQDINDNGKRKQSIEGLKQLESEFNQVKYKPGSKDEDTHKRIYETASKLMKNFDNRPSAIVSSYFPQKFSGFFQSVLNYHLNQK